jgi:hypothetical protein
LVLHWLEIPLHAIHANRNGIDLAEVFRVLCENRREIAVEGHVVAYEYSVADGHGEPHWFVVRVSDADWESAALERGFEIEDSEHLHSVFRNGIFVPYDRDMPERKRFKQSVDDVTMRKRLIRLGSFGSRNKREVVTSDLIAPAVCKKLSLLHNNFLLFQCAE